jgi:hypothetical protein
MRVRSCAARAATKCCGLQTSLAGLANIRRGLTLSANGYVPPVRSAHFLQYAACRIAVDHGKLLKGLGIAG